MTALDVAAVDPTALEPPARRRPFRSVLAGLAGSGPGRIGLVILGFFAAMAVLAPLLAPFDPTAGVAAPFSPPGRRHLLGTNDIGQDILSELVYGARISLGVALLVASLATLVACVVGVLAGYFHGRVSTGLMRFVDVVLVLPFLPLMLLVAAIFGSGVRTQVLVIGLLLWARPARVICAAALGVRSAGHIEAATWMGASSGYILRRHVLPRITPVVVAEFVRAANIAILLEAALAFLGMGDPVAKSWGTMLHYAHVRSAYLTGAWAYWVLPAGACITLVVLGFALVGFAVEQWTDPAYASEAGLPLLEVQGLTVSYATDRGRVRALQDVNFDLDAGEVVGVVGESGSGKTTLVLAVLRLVPIPGRVDAGSMSLDGRNLRELSPVAMRRLRGKELAFVPQAAMSSLNPVMTVGSQIGESLTLHTDLTGAAARRRVAEVLEMVELERATADRYPHQLSGGMRQRAVIAMALAPRPRVILADEPTSGLDVLVRVQVLRLLRDLAGQLGVALLLVSHDLPMVSRWCDRAVVMYAGRVVEEGPAAELLTAPLHPYAEALGRSLPRLRGNAAPRPIPGEVPDLTKLPAGCPFRGRCTREMAACADRMPAVITVGGHRVACHLHEGDGVRLEPEGNRHGD